MGKSFRELTVWQKAIQLTVSIYKLSAQFPDSEKFGLTNQMRRAAVSVGSNIAEGYGRSTMGEYILFLGHARGSCSELETQIVIAKALGFGKAERLELSEKLCDDVGRLLGGLLKSLRAKQAAPKSLSPKSLSPSVP